MALIYKTTLVPSKRELLGAWLPSQPWYSGDRSGPSLSGAGGFRLDDPAGEVGIEFMVVNDASGPAPSTYHVPLTYRGAPLADAEEGLLGTAEHGVLGTRWIYDGAHDPVFVAQVLALLEGNAEAQAQSETDTPDPTVLAHLTTPGRFAAEDRNAVRTGPLGTDIVGISFVTDTSSRPADVHVVRALDQAVDDPLSGLALIGEVVARWTDVSDVAFRGRLVVARNA